MAIRTTATAIATTPATTPATAAAPALPELLAVLKRMRLPYLRNAAPEVLATARAQRWDPAEVLRVLIAEEIRGRDEATRRMRRRPPDSRPGRRLSPGAKRTPRSHPAPRPGWPPWNGSAARRISTGHRRTIPGTRRPTSIEAVAQKVIGGMRVSWFTWKPSPPRSAKPPVDGSIKTVARITRAELIVIDDIGMLPARQAAGGGVLPRRRRRL